MVSRVAIVTGAGRGLGRADALDLARVEMRIALNDRNAAAVRVLDEHRAIGVVATREQLP